MNQITLCIAALATIATLAVPAGPVSAEPPRTEVADIDFEGSGFVIPAGATDFAQGFTAMPGQSATATPMQYPVQQAGMTMPPNYGNSGYGNATPVPAAMGYPGGNIAQVGYFAGASDCDSCDASPGGCGCGSHGGGRLFNGQWLGCNGPMQACDPILSGGLLGKMHGGCAMGGDCGSCGGACGGQGCIAAAGGAGLSGLRHMCLFCRGGGCSACQLFNPMAFTSILSFMKPYSEGGKCAQRWYDLSAEALFLGHSSPGTNLGVVTTRGPGATGVPVLFGGAGGDADLEGGVRLSGALIFGPGSNLEGTYMGGHEWSDSAIVTDAGANLFSFVSDFGVTPTNGFDDTDRSLSQEISTSSKFHSGELNYRRRTMGPYCRFQGSWLAGLRYARFDSSLGYETLGTVNNTGGANTLRFFNSETSTKNNFFGAQLGFDLWYNLMPGVSFGVEAKGAWGQNDYETLGVIQANSIAAFATPGQVAFREKDRDITTMGEFQFAMNYRLSHSWAFRSAYYLIAIDDVLTPTLDRDAIIAVTDNNAATQIGDAPLSFNSVVLNGFSFGAEYTW